VTARDLERRKDDRIKCRIACGVHYGGKTIEGLIRDVSRGGLSLQTVAPLGHGETAQLLIPRAGVRPEIYLEAIVWYDRTMNRRKSGETLQVLGLMLSDAPDI
jgi:hypothetical protein